MLVVLDCGMLELHRSTSDFLIAFYNRASRYYALTVSLLSQGFLDYETALYKIRMEIYGLYNQIFKLLQPLRRRLTRYNGQIDRCLEVSVFICVSCDSQSNLVSSWVFI